MQNKYIFLKSIFAVVESKLLIDGLLSLLLIFFFFFDKIVYSTQYIIDFGSGVLSSEYLWQAQKRELPDKMCNKRVIRKSCNLLT